MKFRFQLSWFKDEGEERGALVHKEIEASDIQEVFEMIAPLLSKEEIATSELKVYQMIYHEKDGEILEDHLHARGFKPALMQISLEEKVDEVISILENTMKNGFPPPKEETK